MDVFTAEPLASVKEFLATTPRRLILCLAVLCMVTVISASAAIVAVYTYGKRGEKGDDHNPNSEDEGGDFKRKSGDRGGDPNRNRGVEPFYSHHAVIFGSRRDVIGSVTAALGRCGSSPAAAAAATFAGDDDSSSNSTTSTMKILIACEGNDAELEIKKIGEYVECPDDIGPIRYCTIPLLHVSYVSFDCVMDRRPVLSLPVAEVAVTSVLATTFGCDDSSTNSTTAAEESVPAIVFLHMKRFCSRDDIVTVPGCMGGNYTTAFGECARRTSSSWDDSNDGTDATTDCLTADCPRPPRIIDDTECDADDDNPLDRDSLDDGDELEDILVAYVSAIRDRQQQ
jgi:hypothetical protein